MMNDMGRKIKKVVLLGLDGATFQLIDPMIEEGLLPNFARIKHEGVWGPLRSNIHPITPSAWASISTGLNPGKHGIFDFRALERKNYHLRFVTGKDRKGDAIWTVLNKHGLQTGVVNVPLTYPPEPMYGFMVSGMDTPYGETGWTYPAEFSSEIQNAISDYRIDLNVPTANLDDYVAQVESLLDSRIRLFRYIMEQKKSLDFLFFVFVETDRFQHVLWKYVDPNSADYHDLRAASYRRVLQSCYQRVDALLGEYACAHSPETAWIIVSDHGFGPLKKDVYLNRWLEEIGLLTFKDNHFTGQISFLENIDWNRTKAYSYGFFGNINLNLRGREARGIVGPAEAETIRQHIREEAVRLRDPETGENVLTGFYTKEELYTGPWTTLAPDLLLVLGDYSYTTRDGYESIAAEIFSNPMKHHIDTIPHSGIHRLDGIFMMFAPGSNLVGIGDRIIGLCDIFPSILKLFGLESSSDCDGKSLI